MTRARAVVTAACGLVLASGHPVLADLFRDLARARGQGEVLRPPDLFNMSAHRSTRLRMPPQALSDGIRTEHMLDEEGTPPARVPE